MHPNNSDTKLNLASANIVALKESQDIKAQFIFFYTIYSILSILTIIISRWLKLKSQKYLEINIRD